jgi:hypothetical protein
MYSAELIENTTGIQQPNGPKSKLFGAVSMLMDWGRDKEHVGPGGKEPSRRLQLAHKQPHTQWHLLSRDCKVKFIVFPLLSLSVSSLLPSVYLLMNPSLIRRRCQHANKISSFNISLKL